MEFFGYVDIALCQSLCSYTTTTDSRWLSDLGFVKTKPLEAILKKQLKLKGYYAVDATECI